MTHDRGDYRSIYGALWRGKDFRRLTKDPRWLLVALRHNLGAAGIRALDAPDAMMMAWTALTEPELYEARCALVDARWVEYEENVYWVVRALEFEPSLKVKNALHRTHIQNHIASLPRLGIVGRFTARYPAWFEGAAPSAPDNDLAEAQERLAKPSRNTETETEPETPQSQRDHRDRDRQALAFHVRCVIALNEAMAAHPFIGKRMREVSASEQQGVVSWEGDGIPVEVAERVIRESTLRYRVTERNPQPFSLKYFDSAVRDAWERDSTKAAALPSAPLFPVVT